MVKKAIFSVLFVGFGIFPLSAVAQQSGADLFLRPAQGSFFVGSTFDVSVVLDTGGKAINTIEVELLFPPDILQLASPSTGSSIV